MNLNQVNFFFFVRSFSVKLKNGEDDRAKRSKCWTVHSWVGRLILVTITLV